LTSTEPLRRRADTWTLERRSDPRYSASLEKGLAILSCFNGTRPVLGVSDVAEQLGLSRSTTHRYLVTLLTLGYLEQDASRKYRLGLRVTDLGIAAMNATGLHEHARPLLEELRSRTSFTTALAVLDGADIVYVERLLGGLRSFDQLELQAGSRVPAYYTAMGKLLLANLSGEERRRLMAPVGLEKLAPNTITSKKTLERELEQIVAAGFAVNDEELAPRLLAIAAPVRNRARDVVAAVGLSADSSVIALGELVDALGPHLISTADRISARLGHRRDDELGTRLRHVR
jgi:IclR family pca regulon transcriptional regulator